jgi:phosphate transport system substrate-binding protein
MPPFGRKSLDKTFLWKTGPSGYCHPPEQPGLQWRFSTSGGFFMRPIISFVLLRVLLATAAILVGAGCQEKREGRLLVEGLSEKQQRQPSAHQYEVRYENYLPFAEENQLTPLRAPPTLVFQHIYPRLDGATAFFPLYAAAARALYQEADGTSPFVPRSVAERQEYSACALRDDPSKTERNKSVCFNRTPVAYENLIKGKVDMIFALAPSERQKSDAADQGVTLTLTPVAKEAFVFLVHKQNPVQSLRVAEARAIYSGEINNWNTVGGRDEKIIPFQRPEGSGSQTILLQEVMRGTPVREPVQEELVGAMGRVSHVVADPRNFQNALAYSFRFYAQTMNPVPGVRLLSIDGVAPTPENIRTGRYPLTVDVYMVTAYPLSENTQKLRDWFLSPQGQQLVEDVGYIPVAPPPKGN